MKILAIETSCDETSCAIVEDGRYIHSNIVSTQIDEHKLYGGVVPEIASRRHLESISSVVNEALKEANLGIDGIDAVAVSYCPGLLGSLIVGVNYAKGLSMAKGLPLIPVHHIKAHISANYLTFRELTPPFMSLVISGGNTMIVNVLDYTKFKIIGRTRDDAVGEAYDKVGRVLGFDYPAGAKIDNLSKKGNKEAYTFKKPKFEDNRYDFSFSGIKTGVMNLYNNIKQRKEELKKEDIAASFQKTVCDMLLENTYLALNDKNIKTLTLAGGVAANSFIRESFLKRGKEEEVRVFLPDKALCGDNAAMVGAQAFYEFKNNNLASSALDAIATLSIED